jgi:hypothetical protein
MRWMVQADIHISTEFEMDHMNDIDDMEYVELFARLAEELERRRNEDRKIVLRPECSDGNLQWRIFS